MQTNGYLLIDKPEDWTSYDVVAKVRNLLKKETGQRVKVGHTGTLDPAATGLLILVIGNYTKRAAEFSKLDKTYEAELTLGAISVTGDREGKITHFSNLKPTKTKVEYTTAGFIGTQAQIPHRFSAKKIDGQRAYLLSSAGKEVRMKPQKVSIYSIEGVEYAYPKLKFTTRVSSGTYIRSLAEDMGDRLGTGAYLSSLRRIKVGKWKIEQSESIDNITNNDIIKIVRQLSS